MESKAQVDELSQILWSKFKGKSKDVIEGMTFERGVGQVPFNYSNSIYSMSTEE